ncbi:MAG: S-layer homology domain-containing protein, partial [Clostridiales bacterium]|nr:S-layer homology domain-containing protein [Clostridiales bacterium]
LFCLLFIALIFVQPFTAVHSNAFAADDIGKKLPGWEAWIESDCQNTIKCPHNGATFEEIIYYVNKIVTENAGVLDERFGNSTPICLQFDYPELGTKSEAERALLVSYLNSVNASYGRIPIEISMQTILHPIMSNVVSAEVSLHNRESSREDQRYSSATVAYEGTDVEFYDSLVEIAEYKPAVDAKIREIGESAKKFSDNATGQLKFINDYLVKNVKYDYDFAQWNESDRKSFYDLSGMPYNAYGALVNGLAVCSGFSHAVAELCDYLDIPNFIYDNEIHSWNMAYVDDAWKMLDVTWNATGDDAEEYFLVDDVRKVDGSHSHVYAKSEIESKKKETLSFWELKRKYDSCFDYYDEHKLAIDALTSAGIFVGNADGELNLQKGLTRAELAVLLTRLNDMEGAVRENLEYYASVAPFSDVPAWAEPYVGYCYEEGLMKGYNDNTFGSNDAVNVKMASTVILRQAGYVEADWSYDTSIERLRSAGIMPKFWPTGTTALRNDIAMMIYYNLLHTKSNAKRSIQRYRFDAVFKTEIAG